MGAQSIKIPVELELSNLRNSISSLQNALKKIDPNSKQYENLSKGLNKIEQQYRSLENASKRTFKNTTEINNFEKTFEKVAYSIENLASDFGRVKFKDLKIDIFSQEDIDRIQQAGQNIKDIQNEIDDLKITKLKELTTSNAEIQQLFSELKIDPDITNFEDTIKRVKQSISEVQRSLKTLNSKQKKTQGRKDAVDAKIAGISGLSMKGSLAEMFGAQFFDSSGQKYKSGGKQALTTYLASLGLDSKNIERVRNATATELKAFAKEIVDSLQGTLPNLKVSQKNLQDELNSIAADISKKTDELDLKNSSLGAIEGIDPAIKTELEALTNRLNEAYKELEKLKQELAATKGVSKESNGAIKDTGEAIQSASENFEEGRKSADAFNEASRKVGEIKSAIKRWFGFNEVINLTKNAVRNAINHIRELDKVMTEIAVVTDMTQDDLWNQISTYSDMAQQYGAATAGVYEVSQLYYQQGLQTAEVMKLTEETLKMAKIANLDYADATDYMTVAIRGFKLEMSDAQNIVDVYSNIAAVTASDTEELAVAMSKTASSAEAVGSSFENTTAMIALMVETTREAPEIFSGAYKKIA